MRSGSRHGHAKRRGLNGSRCDGDYRGVAIGALCRSASSKAG